MADRAALATMSWALFTGISVGPSGPSPLNIMSGEFGSIGSKTPLSGGWPTISSKLFGPMLISKSRARLINATLLICLGPFVSLARPARN